MSAGCAVIVAVVLFLLACLVATLLLQYESQTSPATLGLKRDLMDMRANPARAKPILRAPRTSIADFALRLKDLDDDDELTFVVLLEACRKCIKLEQTLPKHVVVLDAETIRQATGEAAGVLENISSVPTERLVTRKNSRPLLQRRSAQSKRAAAPPVASVVRFLPTNKKSGDLKYTRSPL